MWSAKDARLLGDLVKRAGLEEVTARMERLFSGRGPSWLRPPYTVGSLASQWNALVADGAPGRREQQSPTQIAMDELDRIEREEREERDRV